MIWFTSTTICPTMGKAVWVEGGDQEPCYGGVTGVVRGVAEGTRGRGG